MAESTSGRLRRRQVARAVAVTLFALSVSAGCGWFKGSNSPAGPSEVPAEVTVSFRFFNHARGPLGDSVRTVNRGDTITIRVRDLGYGGIHPNMLIARQAATAGRVGPLVAVVPCASPALLTAGVCTPGQEPGAYHHLATTTQSLDVFLMNTSGGVDYDGCVATALAQARSDVFLRGQRAFSTLRLATPGERIDGEPAVAPPSDAAFRYAAEEYTRAMNPFGVRYGALEFVGSQSADVTGGYVVDPVLPWAGVTSGRSFWVRLRAQIAGDPPSRNLSYETAFHEIGHAFMGQPDQYLGPDVASFACRFPVEPFGPFSGLDNGWPVLSPLQRDILAYWALLLG